jgi:hypothetical protein
MSLYRLLATTCGGYSITDVIVEENPLILQVHKAWTLWLSQSRADLRGQDDQAKQDEKYQS